MNKHSFKKTATIFCAAALLMLATACSGSRVTMSKTLFIANVTDTALVSLKLDAKNPSLEETIELLDSPLAPGAVREIVVGLPEKQAKKSEWSVRPTTEDGAECRDFSFGEFNPHADNPVGGFYIEWFEDHYGAGVTFMEREDYISSNPLLYAEGEEPSRLPVPGPPSSQGLLAINEKYITEGNPVFGYILFADDGTAYYEVVTGDFLEGEYVTDGITVNAYFIYDDELWEYEFEIADEDTLEVPNGEYEPYKFIRESAL